MPKFKAEMEKLNKVQIATVIRRFVPNALEAKAMAKKCKKSTLIEIAAEAWEAKGCPPVELSFA